jgi:hypothetical protein
MSSDIDEIKCLDIATPGHRKSPCNTATPRPPAVS